MAYIYEQWAKPKEGEIHTHFALSIFLKWSVIIYFFTIDSHYKNLTFIFQSHKKIPVHHIRLCNTLLSSIISPSTSYKLVCQRLNVYSSVNIPCIIFRYANISMYLIGLVSHIIYFFVIYRWMQKTFE